MKPLLPYGGATAAFGLFLGLTLLIQAGVMAPLDEAGMRLLVAWRPEWLAEPMNWAFRLGFVQVDLAIALLWCCLLVVRRRPWGEAAAPLLLVAAIGLQAGMRLVVDQPAPRGGFELQRVSPSQPVGLALDRADAAAREGLAAVAVAAAPAGTAGGERGSYPSGHACRVLFLALLAISFRRLALSTILIAIALVVGYSTMYFGYHWPSDVVGGYLMGAGVYGVARRVRGIGMRQAVVEGRPTLKPSG